MQDLRIKELCKDYPQLKEFFLDFFDEDKKEHKSVQEKIDNLFKRKEDQSC